MPRSRRPVEPDPVVLARLAAVRPGVAPPEPPPLPEAAEPPEPGLVGALRAAAARVPEPLRTARLDPRWTGARALVAVALAGSAFTGLVVWRARPHPVAVAPPSALPSRPPAAGVVVDVAGAVRRPGLVRLPPGSRVADAIAAAGGLRPGASTGTLNLARRLADGEQVLVGAAPAAGPGPSSGALVDLNVATAAQLDALPGVGPVLAQRIVQWRTAHGRFASVDQLREVSGIGAKKLDSLRSLVTV